LVKRRSDVDVETVEKFLTKMYRTNADFVFTVSRDFVHKCQTPALILPDDIPAHPYAVAMKRRCSRRQAKSACSGGRNRRSGKQLFRSERAAGVRPAARAYKSRVGISSS
jgi:hypothetical protein